MAVCIVRKLILCNNRPAQCPGCSSHTPESEGRERPAWQDQGPDLKKTRRTCRVPTSISSIHVLITVVPIGEMIATKGAPTWLDEVDGGSAVSSLSGCAPSYERITWRLRKDAVPTIRALAIVKKMGPGHQPSTCCLSDLQRESMLTLIWKKCQAVTCLHEHPVPGFFRLGSRPELLAVFAVDD